MTLSYFSWGHTSQCKRTSGCYNELVVAFLRTGDGLKGNKNLNLLTYDLFISLHLCSNHRCVYIDQCGAMEHMRVDIFSMKFLTYVIHMFNPVFIQ